MRVSMCVRNMEVPIFLLEANGSETDVKVLPKRFHATLIPKWQNVDNLQRQLSFLLPSFLLSFFLLCVSSRFAFSGIEPLPLT